MNKTNVIGITLTAIVCFCFGAITMDKVYSTQPPQTVIRTVVITPTSLPVQPEPTQQVLVFFANKSEPLQNYEEPTPDSKSGLPFDQNQDGLINCIDFSDKEKPGIDKLLDLAYNRYGYKYLDSNQDSIPCNE